MRDSGTRERLRDPDITYFTPCEASMLCGLFWVLIIALMSASSTISKLNKASQRTYGVRWGNVWEVVWAQVPRLDADCHKGQSARVGVLGGSVEYTGAPYYAAMAGLRAGGDLATVLCADEAAGPIKSFSPELMVRGIYSEMRFDVGSEMGSDVGPTMGSKSCSAAARPELGRVVERGVALVGSYLPRVHVLVVGPGLGRSPEAFGILRGVAAAARERGLPMVWDADALFMLTQESSAVTPPASAPASAPVPAPLMNLDLVQGRHNVVLTPNAMEFKRLCVAAGVQWRDCGTGTETGMGRAKMVSELAAALGGVTVLLKGRTDLISCGRVCLEVVEEGSPRRVGGQGDVLAGILGVMMRWLHRPGRASAAAAASARDDGGDGGTGCVCLPLPVDLYDTVEQAQSMWAAAGAALLTRRSSRLAFSSHARSMSSVEVLACVGHAWEAMVPADGSRPVLSLEDAAVLPLHFECE